LTTALTGMHDSLLRAARASIAQQTEGQEFTAMERTAMEAVEALRLLNSWDLAAILERGRIIKWIEDDGLVGVFPGDYTTLEQIASEVGVSPTEVSDTRTLCNVIFPWLETNSGQPVAYWWDRIGKSKFRELVPVLSALINGNPTTNAETVRASIEHLLDQVQVNATANGEGQLDEQTLRTRAIANVLEIGQLPTLEMRRQVRPDGTPNISGVRLVRQNDNYVVLHVSSPEQDRMLSRLLGHHVDINNLDAQQAPALNEQLRRLGL
jgi:hypothetical protein